MGNTKNKQIRNLHARRYIQAVFGRRLRKAGFVCPDDKLLCWYRLNDNEIVNSICFFSRWPNVPVMPEIAYGIHPLFVKPFSSNDIYVSNVPDDERFYTAGMELEGQKRHFAPYSADILVYSQNGQEADVLDRVILPQMDAVKTLEQCYLFHRKMFRSATFGMSSLMIDEAIILNNSAAQERCRINVDKMISHYSRLCSKYPDEKGYQDKLKHAKLQKAALCGSSRGDYIADLEKRAGKNLKALIKEGIFPWEAQ